MTGSPETRTLVIVGGGTAGWLTAGLIAAKHRAADENGLRVVLVESPNVAIIGVGEGTWPTIRTTLKRIGVSETDFLRSCDASFKQGSNFRGWVDGADSYYHPFMVPKGFDDTNLAAAWAGDPQGKSFGDAVAFQPEICARRLAPKTLATPEYEAVATYAYHLDAGKFAPFLRDHCVAKLGVIHVLADVRRVENDDTGHVSAIHCDGRDPVTGDLFIDCTGFAALLIGKHCGVATIPVGDQLFIDTALAAPAPYETEDAPIASVTVSAAQRAGWIWDIGLTTRRGMGHVYSSRFTSDDQALADLAAYAGRPLAETEVRKIPIRSGFRDRPWVGNVAAVGLAMGFVEPLEASSIVMVELAAQMIADQMPLGQGSGDRAAMAVVAKRYNDLFAHRWRGIVDFLKLHYVLSRRDEPFWAANRDADTIPASLQDRLTVWRQRFPWHDDFPYKDEIFSDASYQYVLYGMGFQTRLPDWASLPFEPAVAERHRREVDRARAAVGQLPGHRQLLTQLRTQNLRAAG